MAATDNDAAWVKAQADYVAGVSLAGICKKHKVKMHALLKRIRDENWLRLGEKNKRSMIPAAPADDRGDRIKAAIEEAVEDIILGHRSISSQMRHNLDDEIAEYQELKQYFISALDKQQIEELMANTDDDKQNPALVQHLQSCLASFGKRVQSLEKLVRLSALIVDTERKVWAIGVGTGDEAETYDDLLELCTTSLPTRALPAGVADFERALKKREGG